MNDRFKVRPFDKVIDFEHADVSLRCSGRIEDDAFVFSVGTGVHRLPTIGAGSDKSGEFVFIGPTERALPAGFMLVVEAEPEYPEPDTGMGCSISLKRPSDDVTAMREQLRDAGIDPSSAHLLAAPSAMVSIYFTAHGTVNGWGGAGFPVRESRSQRPN